MSVTLLPQDKARIQSFYAEKLKLYGGHSPRSLNWINKSTQYNRFEVFMKIGNLEGKNILDVGCGIGDFYGYLESHCKNFNYYGIELVSELIVAGKNKYPRARFEEMNMQNIDKIRDPIDYSFASGAFSFKIHDYREFYFSIIKKMYTISKIGIGFNMLDIKAHISDSIFAAYSHLEVVDFCEGFSKKVRLIQGYLKHDFTIFVLK